MSLFQWQPFVSSAGLPLNWKIECDDLSNESIDCLAQLIVEKYQPKKVVSVPTGGDRLATAICRHNQFCKGIRPVVVDDVLTTGKSIKRVMDQHPGSIGIVLFARHLPPDNVVAVFELGWNFQWG